MIGSGRFSVSGMGHPFDTLGAGARWPWGVARGRTTYGDLRQKCETNPISSFLTQKRGFREETNPIGLGRPDQCE